MLLNDNRKRMLNILQKKTFWFDKFKMYMFDSPTVLAEVNSDFKSTNIKRILEGMFLFN